MFYRRREAFLPAPRSSCPRPWRCRRQAQLRRACQCRHAQQWAAFRLQTQQRAVLRLQTPDSSTLVAAESKDEGDRVRLGWAEHATQQLIGEAEPNLRKCAQNWLQEKSILHSKLRNSTDNKTKRQYCASTRLAKTVIASTASNSGRPRRMQAMRATFLL